MLVYRFSEKRLGSRAALLLCAFYAFNPAVLVDSAAWGQIDSVLTLLLVVCALRMARAATSPRWRPSRLPCWVKPQALLFAPVGLAALIVARRRPLRDTAVEKRRATREAWTALAGIAVALVTRP